jgi:antitoxin component of RelBE/YafQ-DinJ toxin-antitoxin module
MGRVSAKRRLQVRLTGNLYEAAEQVAERSGISLGSFIRLLVEDALATQPKTVPD